MRAPPLSRRVSARKPRGRIGAIHECGECGEGFVAFFPQLGLAFGMVLFIFGDEFGQGGIVLLVEALRVFWLFILGLCARFALVGLGCSRCGFVRLGKACAACGEAHVVLIILLGHLYNVVIAFERVDGRRDGLVHSSILRFG